MEQITRNEIVRKYIPAATENGIEINEIGKDIVAPIVEKYIYKTMSEHLAGQKFLGTVDKEELLRYVKKLGWTELPHFLVNTAITAIKAYFKDWGVDIDLYDLHTYQYFKMPPKKTDNGELNISGQTAIDGKIQNNIIVIVSSCLEVSTSQRNYEEAYIDLSALIHEILHHLFNLEQNMDLDGKNLSRTLIPENLREGSVQYITEKIYCNLDESTTLKLNQLPPQFYSTVCINNGIYNMETKMLRNYLHSLSKSLSKKLNLTFEQAYNHVIKSFLSFFIQSDKSFLDIPKKYQLTNENNEPIKDFIDLNITLVKLYL